MKIVAKKDRKLLLINTGNTQNENKAETIELTVPEEYEDYNKKIVFVTDDGIVWDIVQDNTYKPTKAITKYKQVDFYIWLTKDDVDFRTETRPLRFYHNEDASDEITPEEISGVNTVVNILEEEITKVDSLETELRALITDIQNKLDNGEFDGKDGKDGQDAKINGKNSIEIEAGNNITIDNTENGIRINSTGGGSGGTSNYNDLSNKPKINNVELNGNKSLNDLGIQPSGNYALESEIPTKTSELINDSDFITPSYHDDTKQNIVDESLTTVNKTIPTAINEVNSIAKGVNQDVNTKYDYLSKLSNLFEKITATGTNITLNNTSDTILKIGLNANDLTQDGSPSPSNPQNIHVIKGNNEIKISNYETDKEYKYTINLGDIEICKIEDYGDELFKNTLNSEYYNSSLELNKWYKLARIRKLELNISDMNNNEDYPGWRNVPNLRNDFPNASSGIQTYTTAYKCNIAVLGMNLNTLGTNSILFLHKSNFGLTQSQWKTTYPNLVLELYYRMATPTYTLLNDTLQTQLDNLQYALAYDTQTNISQTNTDLPFIIDAETYTKINAPNGTEQNPSQYSAGATSPLADKNIVVFGDSLTDPQAGGISWTESFINIAEYNSFRGYGRGYCTWTFKNDTEYNITDNTDANVGSNVIWNQFNKLKHDVDNNNTPIPDIIMIFCADNDILQSKTTGSESATFKAETQSSDVKTLTNMMDSIRYNIDTINAEYPNCIIVPIIPLLPSQYERSKTYRGALITCYNNLGLSYIDVMYGSGIAWYREVMKKTYFANDGVHLSEAGSMKIAKFIYQSLITMPRIQKLPSTTTNKGLYNVYYNFTNATSTNSFASVMQGEPYRATVSATTGYSLTSVTCTMGGVAQTITNNTIDIASASGNIVVTAVASPDQPTTSYTVTNNLTNATNSNVATSVEAGNSYSATISANTGFHITSVSCTMGGVAQTVTNNSISIAEVTGNIVITAVADFVPVQGAYIHNDGNCWVGSSYYPTQATTRLELVADVHSFSNNYGYLVGSGSTKLCQWKNTNEIGCVAGGAYQRDEDLVSMSYDKKFTLDADIANKVLTITDEDGTRTSSIKVGTASGTTPIWYFAGYYENNFEHKSGDMKIYSFKIWEGETLVYAGYPISDSTGVGIYDAVSGTTNYNEGTGTLTYGVDSAS